MSVASMTHPSGVGESSGSGSQPNWRVLTLSLFLPVAAGLMVSAAADNAARANSAVAGPLFWIGLLGIFAPISIRLFKPGISKHERLLLVLTLYLTLYLVSFMQYPLLFTTHDSLGQLRSAEDIVQTGHLFRTNPLVGAYASYPGIELATLSLSQLSGLSLFVSGTLLIGVARVVLAVSLFAAIERLTDARAAGIACLIYAANPSFLFFDTQFFYESLALPLAILALAVLVHRRPSALRWETALALFLACAVVVTHFATTLWLVVLIILWVLIDSLPISRRMSAPPRLTALLVLAAALEWFFVIARTTTIAELGPVEASVFSSVVGLLTGRSASKQVFAPSSGAADEPVLQVISFLSVGILLFLIAVSIWHWRRIREPIRLTLLVLMLLYPLSLVLRLTADGTETSQRASEFVFIGIGFGAAGLSTRMSYWPRSYHHLGAVIVTVIFIGGIVVGNPSYSRLPGPYLVGADSRSLDARTIVAATWVREHIPVGSVFAADRSNGLALTAIGLADPAEGLLQGQTVPYLYFSSTFNSRDWATIHAFRIRYILVDLRLSTAVPYIGLYFSPNEPLAGHYAQPIPQADLAKFATAPGLVRIYDNEDIQIYEVSMKGVLMTGQAPKRVPPDSTAPRRSH